MGDHIVKTKDGIAFDTLMLSLNLSTLNVGTYQRALDLDRVNKIAQNWNDYLFRCPVVNRRADGHFYIVDGNHSAHAFAIKYPNAPIPCNVISGLTESDEAALFTQLNTNIRKPSFSALLNAKAQYGDDKAVEYFLMLDEINIPYSFGGKAINNELICHQKTYKLLHKYGKETLQTALSLIAENYSCKNRFHAEFVSALTAFIHYYPGANIKRLIKILQENTVDNFVAEIHKMKGAAGKRRGANGGSGGIESECSIGALAIVSIYNYRLPAYKQLDGRIALT